VTGTALAAIGEVSQIAAIASETSLFILCASLVGYLAQFLCQFVLGRKINYLSWLMIAAGRMDVNYTDITFTGERGHSPADYHLVSNKEFGNYLVNKPAAHSSAGPRSQWFRCKEIRHITAANAYSASKKTDFSRVSIAWFSKGDTALAPARPGETHVRDIAISLSG
jgi:hypothetical protein